MVNFNLQSKPACMRKKKDTQGQTPKCEARKSKVVVGAEEAPIEFQSAIKAGLHAQIEGYTRAKAQMPNPPMGCGGAAAARIKHHGKAGYSCPVFVYALAEPK
jgi:hypothetical protein